MNLAMAQTTNGKMVRKQARKAAESRIPNRVSNLFGSTFFGQAARMGWETTPRSAVICGLAGKFRTGEKV